MERRYLMAKHYILSDRFYKRYLPLFAIDDTLLRFYVPSMDGASSKVLGEKPSKWGYIITTECPPDRFDTVPIYTITGIIPADRTHYERFKDVDFRFWDWSKDKESLEPLLSHPNINDIVLNPGIYTKDEWVLWILTPLDYCPVSYVPNRWQNNNAFLLSLGEIKDVFGIEVEMPDTIIVVGEKHMRENGECFCLDEDIYLQPKHFRTSVLKYRDKLNEYWTANRQRREMLKQYLADFDQKLAQPISKATITLAKKIKTQLQYKEVFPATFCNTFMLAIPSYAEQLQCIELESYILTYANRRIELWENAGAIRFAQVPKDK